MLFLKPERSSIYKIPFTKDQIRIQNVLLKSLLILTNLYEDYYDFFKIILNYSRFDIFVNIR